MNSPIHFLLTRLACGLAVAGLVLTGCGDKHDDHAHGHHGPHDGEVAAFSGGDVAGFVELKLHDDKGDLELWIASDEAITKPHDLPLDATITVTFADHENKVVTLRVRNTDKNEDEDGKANNRDGKTNYFIFPGDTGADASWLKGADFKSNVTVQFTSGETKVSTKSFLLRPHGHADHSHSHD